MADVKLKITNNYVDGTARTYEFGPFADDSARIAAIAADPKVELKKFAPFLAATVSDNGEESSQLITAAKIVATTKTPIDLTAGE